jgi:hypothetical protein
MTRDEWDTIALLIENCWRGEFDEVQSSAYYTMLRRFNHGEVMAALHRLVEDEKPFLPTVPEIVGAIRKIESRGIPAWTEVWSKMKIALGKGSEQEAIDFMRDLHPIAAAFLSTEGFDRLRYEPFFDPDYGAIRVRDLHQRWNEFSERSSERQKQGLAIEATKRSGLGLDRMDATRLLPDGASE